MANRRVAIVGVGYSKVGRKSGLSERHRRGRQRERPTGVRNGFRHHPVGAIGQLIDAPELLGTAGEVGDGVQFVAGGM